MKQFAVVINVDEKALKDVRGSAGKKEPLTESIEQELGWVHESGITIHSIKKVKKTKKVNKLLTYNTAEAVKDYLIELAINDKMPLDINDLSTYALEEVIKKSIK